ncbi:MAG: sialate O-acetylesterase [Kiritimatiellae bacterium]|nr:sialate O-acetylesterase [Kiritimatiellia bacterium]
MKRFKVQHGVRLGLALALGWGLAASGDVRLPALFSEHAVLQQGVPVPVWGWADPGEEVTVAFAGQIRQAKASADGTWRVSLDALKPAQAAAELVVKGKNTLTVKDVWVGEVWLGSGQSNMAMTVNRCNAFEQEKAAAGLPGIRMFTVSRVVGTEPCATCQGSWVVCAPDTVGSFSATAYFMGKELHRKLGVPVGLINSSWGGTPIEAWTSKEAMEAVPALAGLTGSWAEKVAAPWDAAKVTAIYEKATAAWKEQVKKAKAEGKPAPRAPRKPGEPRLSSHRPANLYNAMIAPLIPYALRGAVWYQGESNARDSDAHLYGVQLQTMIQDWRTRWGTAFPFAWVQLPNFRSSDRNWPLVREGMLQALSVPKTGMAITMDIGDPADIHPMNKQDVGLRLAFWALGTVYGKPVEAVSGPLPAGHTVKGNAIVCSFTHTEGGLVAKGGALKGFAIAGADQVWRPADALIVNGTVVVSHPDVKAPVAVRYAWAANPECNLFNGAGLPASPFRTDTFAFPVAAPAKK